MVQLYILHNRLRICSLKSTLHMGTYIDMYWFMLVFVVAFRH